MKSYANTSAQVGNIGDAMKAAGDGVNTPDYARVIAAPNGALDVEETEYFALAVHMKEEAGNEFQGKDIVIDITVLATQNTVEYDIFDNQYDAPAEGFSISASATYSKSADTVIKTGNTAAVGNAEVTIPAGVATVNGEPLDDDEDVNLNIEKTETPANFTQVDNTNGTTTYEVSLETNSGAKIESSGDAFRVKLNIGVVNLQGFYHNNEAMTPATTLDEVNENGKYFYDVNTGIVTFMTTSFSPFTSTYLYDGGLGTASYPYLIGSGKQWYNLLKAYQGYYMGSSTDGIYVDLIGDIDITGYDISDYESYPRNFHLDGHGFKMMNFETSIWGDDATMYLANSFKNLKLKNCHASSNALFAGTQNSNTASVVFENVDLDNCSAVGGAYQYYDGSASATFKDCDATNTHVTGAYMASAGFVGNISTGTLSIDNCTFGGSVVSTQSMCAGFVGQSNSTSSKVVITNSKILSGTVIRNVDATGPVAAFDGSHGTKDYATDDKNEFNGTLENTDNSKAYAQGTSAAKVTYTPICKAADFTFDATTGTLTYNGESELGKAAVQVYVTDDYIYNGKYYGGYNWFLCDPIKKENVVSGTQITGVPIVTDFYNVVSSLDTPVGLKTTDTTYVDEIHNGVFYFDAQTYSWGHYMLGGTYDNNTGTAKEPTSINVYIRITVYGTDGSLNGAISGSLLKYTVDLSNHGN